VWVFPSRFNIKYHSCSTKCQSVAKKIYQKEAALPQVKKVKVKCLVCKKDILVHGYRKKTAKFCNLICRGRYFNGDRSPQWRGGVTPKNIIIRNSFKMKQWRADVFKRDDFTCVLCGKHGDRLNADHIKPFSRFPDLRFDVSNGRTLCVPCHRKTETWGGKSKIFVAL
jgi:5-methylcytosine-specific restriction endonuclease McrA